MYLTYYIKVALAKLERLSKAEAEKAMYQLAIENFQIPGDSGFVFGGYFHNPQGRQEADTVRAYFTQLRQEVGARLVDRVYREGAVATDTPSKWWTCFNKRKFMNLV